MKVSWEIDFSSQRVLEELTIIDLSSGMDRRVFCLGGEATTSIGAGLWLCGDSRCMR
jgi:hypothetical protein